MLRQPESERRRARDDADADHAKWDRYRAEKRRLEDLGLAAEDYDDQVRELAREMGI